MLFDYLINNLPEVGIKTLEHMEITFLAVFLAIIIGVPLGIIVSKNERAGKIILGIANVFQTIPSLALFGFIIPIPIIGGIGYRPAVFVLFLYALLPIIKNTYLGLKSVNPAVIESARGMGMTSKQILLMVSLPLAFPIMMGGIRVATVINIGTATIAALIGAGGLGDFIFAGISMSDPGIIMAGAIPTTILALLVDYLLGLVEKKFPVRTFGHLVLRPGMGKRFLMVALTLILLISGGYIWFNHNDDRVMIAQKNFTESRIMAQLLSVLIEENTDLKTDVRELGGTMPTFEALKNRDIDMYVDYTGTGYVNILKIDGEIPPTDEVYERVREEYQKRFKIHWLQPLGFNNTYTLAVPKDLAEQYQLKTYSDLARISNQLVMGATAEILNRPDGLPGLQSLYDMEFEEIKVLDPGLRYNAVENGAVQVIDAFATDGKLKELNLIILEDDQEYFPPYYAVPLVTDEVIKQHPEIQPLLEQLGGVLDDLTMQELNYRADVEKENLRQVATDFLQQQGLIPQH